MFLVTWFLFIASTYTRSIFVHLSCPHPLVSSARTHAHQSKSVVPYFFCERCVCVSYPVTKGLYIIPETQGDWSRLSSEAMAFRWMSGLINHLYLQITTLQFFRRCSLNFIVLHAIPHTLFQLLATARNLQPALIFPSLSAVKLKLLFKNLQVDSAFLQFSHSFIPGLSYWAKLCPSVSCYAFSLGCIA